MTVLMTSSNGHIFRLLAFWSGNSPVTGEFPAKRPVTRSFDVFFDLRLNEWLGKRSRDWWFETPSRPLWRHSNVLLYLLLVVSLVPSDSCYQFTRHPHGCVTGNEGNTVTQVPGQVLEISWLKPKVSLLQLYRERENRVCNMFVSYL